MSQVQNIDNIEYWQIYGAVEFIHCWKERKLVLPIAFHHLLKLKEHTYPMV